MATTSIKTHSFILELAGVTELTIELSDAIYGAGVEDALIHSSGPVVMVDFDREGETLGSAIDSAVKSVEKAGFKVAKIVVEEFAE